ncbi:MAG: hypothetical protein QXG03_13355 [Halalkalicoccus sp.]
MSRPPAVADRATELVAWLVRTAFPIVALVALFVGPLILGYSVWVAVGLWLAGLAVWWLTAGLSGAYAHTAFGPTDRVDMDTFRGEREVCNACGAVAEEGLKRRYAKQWVLAGLPLYTLDWGENAYCVDCVEPGTLDVREPRDRHDRRERTEPATQR